MDFLDIPQEKRSKKLLPAKIVAARR